MATLYDIDRAILDCLDAETGEIIDVERLTDLQLDREEKIEKVALWYKNLLSDAEQYKAEKQAFEAKEKAAKNKAEGLKCWLNKALGGEAYKTTKVSISYRQSETVVIDDMFTLPDSFKRFSEPEPNKTAIKAAIKEGKTIQGTHLETANNIQIK